MSVIPSQNKLLTKDKVSPENETPPLPHANDQLVIVAVTPAVAQLARVARAIRQERKTPKTGTPLPRSRRDA